MKAPRDPVNAMLLLRRALAGERIAPTQDACLRQEKIHEQKVRHTMFLHCCYVAR